MKIMRITLLSMIGYIFALSLIQGIYSNPLVCQHALSHFSKTLI